MITEPRLKNDNYLVELLSLENIYFDEQNKYIKETKLNFGIYNGDVNTVCLTLKMKNASKNNISESQEIIQGMCKASGIQHPRDVQEFVDHQFILCIEDEYVEVRKVD
jgi:hypothetical protein